MIRKEEIYYDSRDNVNKIHAVKWIPESGSPDMILQIVHGMAEYAECYHGFAEYMAEKNIVVAAEDHLGHGKSVQDGGVQGYFAKQDPATVVVRDVHRLKKMIQEQYPGVPYFILGHSMGSFILRNYLCRYGKGIDGAIIAGTGNQPLGLVSFGKGLARFLALFQGWNHKSALCNSIAFASNNKRIENPRTIFDWLTRDTERIDQYMADPKCGFTFTLNGFYTLFDLVSRLHREENLEKMPKSLPVLIASGTDDPVGKYGKWPEEVYRTFRRLGLQRTELKLYEGSRHEILNELGKEKAYLDIYDWLKRTAAVLEERF